MRIIDFPGSNIVYAKFQPEYFPLPSYKTPDGYVTSCWEPTFWEAVQLMFGAKLWLTTMTFNKPLHPQNLEVAFKMPKMRKKYNVSERA